MSLNNQDQLWVFGHLHFTWLPACHDIRERVPLYFPCAERPGRLGWACWLSCGLGAEAKGSWGRPCLSGLLAQIRAGQLGLRCLGSRIEGLGHVGPIDAMRRTRLLVGEGLRLGPGQGGWLVGLA